MIIACAVLLALLSLQTQEQQGAPQQPEQAPPAQAAQRQSLEISLSQDSVYLEGRRYSANGRDFMGVAIVWDEDDIFAGRFQVMRFAEPRDSRLRFGVGVGAYALYDNDEDADAYAVALMGNVGWSFRTKYPTSAVAEVGYAPDVTTFGDGEELVDLYVGLEVGLNAQTSAYVGWRSLDVDLEDGGDIEALDGIRVGVRVGL